jgi:hypothetical protein
VTSKGLYQRPEREDASIYWKKVGRRATGVNPATLKSERRNGVTPIVATIILISGSLVLGVIVGAYTVGLFGGNVKTIQLDGAALFSGPLPVSPTCSVGNSAYAIVSFNNQGADTNITNIGITGSSLNTTVSVYSFTNSNVCTLIGPASFPRPVVSNGTTISYVTISTNQPNIAAGTVTSLTLYFGGAASSYLAIAQTFSYVIYFANGQTISGALISQ